jgi:hypothetical protein
MAAEPDKTAAPMSKGSDVATGGDPLAGRDRGPQRAHLPLRSGGGGARSAPLDLSLGHIPTIVTDPFGDLLEVFDFGALSVIVDRESMSAVKLVDKGHFPNLVLRRKAMREFDARVDPVLTRYGFMVVWGKQ